MRLESLCLSLIYHGPIAVQPCLDGSGPERKALLGIRGELDTDPGRVGDDNEARLDLQFSLYEPGCRCLAAHRDVCRTFCALHERILLQREVRNTRRELYTGCCADRAQGVVRHHLRISCLG